MSDWTLLSHPVQMAILVNGHAEGSYPLPSAGWRLTRCFQSKLTCLQRESHEFVSEARGQEDNEIQTSPVTSTGKKKNTMISYLPGPSMGPSDHTLSEKSEIFCI